MSQLMHIVGGEVEIDGQIGPLTHAIKIRLPCAGEIHELQEELCNPNKDKKKEAVKKVIAAMTVGKDVSVLFPHVVNCMQTPNIELKKLVYLYLINYAKSQPDLAILAVNTFVKVLAGFPVLAPRSAHPPGFAYPHCAA